MTESPPNSRDRRQRSFGDLWIDMHTEGAEWWNGLIHAVGCLLGVVASVGLLWQVRQHGTRWNFISCLVYCVALVGVYAASTLSHWIREPMGRHRWRSWDQGMIFLFIVATFTPLAVAHLTGWWYLLTGLMWTFGILGFVSKVVHARGVDKIVLWLYLAMGWLPVLALPALWPVVPGLVVLLLAGGMAYTIGSILLINDHRSPFFHAGWHVFVIMGTAFHFVAIYLYAVPRA